uniref:Uncharacterized protein n=1 Tax=Anguilla anguilla TaxID=7936 RepID=A0A0E9WWW4_ANGAN
MSNIVILVSLINPKEENLYLVVNKRTFMRALFHLKCKNILIL